MGRFETQWLAARRTFVALANLSGQWIDLVHGRRPPPRHGLERERVPSCLEWPLRVHLLVARCISAYEESVEVGRVRG